MSKAFVSYSSEDMRMAIRLTNDLIIKSPISIFLPHGILEAEIL
jgi:hypothetical protein